MFRQISRLAAVAILVTACGADGDVALTTEVIVTTTGADVTTSAVESTVAATDASAPDGIVPIEVAPCDLLTADEVAVATGFPVVEMRDDPPLNCVFILETDGNIFVFVGIEDGMGRFAGAANLFAEYTLLIGDGRTEAFAGIGEGAVCCPFRTMAVDAGDGRFIAVGVAGTYDELAEPLEALESLAEAALARL